MTRLLAALLAGLAVVGSGAAQPGPAEKKLEGTYSVLSATRGGKPEDKKLDAVTFEFKDGMITITAEGRKKEDTAGYKVDPTKTPAHIDLTPARMSTAVVKGIYELKTTPDGVVMTLAFTREGGERPADFKGEGENTTVLKLLRKGGK
jgi:uncharacterized protein (TIGR03067 family)